ncbi:MAG: hypothetical protein HC877_18890 [Thioploca sp.]|nr:hypothetical protein [Thioploca sp.]
MKLDYQPYNDKGVPGIHSYIDLVNCPKKVYNKLNRIKSEYISDGAAVGTILHHWAHAFYTIPEFDGDLEIQFPKDYPLNVIQEGNIVGKRYVTDRNVAEFGKILHAEQRIIFPSDELYKEMGMPFPIPFSFQADLYTDISKYAAVELSKQFLVEPKNGKWLIDHKTYSRRSKTIVDEHLAMLQPSIYSLAMKLMGFDNNGCIMNFVFNYKYYNEYMILPIETPDSHMRETIKTFWYLVGGTLSDINDGLYKANPAMCLLGWSLCPHLLFGSCDRKDTQL